MISLSYLKNYAPSINDEKWKDRDWSKHQYHRNVARDFFQLQKLINKILKVGKFNQTEFGEQFSFYVNFKKHQEYLCSDRAQIKKMAKSILQKLYGNVTMVFDEHYGLDRDRAGVQVVWGADAKRIGNPSEEEKKDLVNGKLFRAVIKEDIDKIDRCIRTYKADPNAKGPYGKTPLYYVWINSEIIDLLCDRGAKVNVVDDENLSPLDVALDCKKQSRLKEFVMSLRKYGAITGEKIKERRMERMSLSLERPNSSAQKWEAISQLPAEEYIVSSQYGNQLNSHVKSGEKEQDPAAAIEFLESLGYTVKKLSS